MGSRMELPIQSSPPHRKLCYLGETLLQSFMGLTFSERHFSERHFSDKFLTSVVFIVISCCTFQDTLSGTVYCL